MSHFLPCIELRPGMRPWPDLVLYFSMQQQVWLKARPEPLPGYITGLLIRPGTVAYLVAWGDGNESSHYDFELSEEPEI